MKYCSTISNEEYEKASIEIDTDKNVYFLTYNVTKVGYEKTTTIELSKDGLSVENINKSIDTDLLKYSEMDKLEYLQARWTKDDKVYSKVKYVTTIDNKTNAYIEENGKIYQNQIQNIDPNEWYQLAEDLIKQLAWNIVCLNIEDENLNEEIYAKFLKSIQEIQYDERSIHKTIKR